MLTGMHLHRFTAAVRQLLAYPALLGWRALCGAALRRFRGRLHHGAATNDQTLVAILHGAQQTRIGRRFEFANMLAADDPVDEFRRHVPVRDYAAHADDIQAIANGATDVLFAGRPSMFVATSGTSSDPKLLPTNRAQQQQALRHIALLAPAMRWEAAPQLRPTQRSINLMLASSPTNKLPGGILLGMSSGGGVRKVLGAAPFIWTSPAAVFELQDHATALYLHALFGLRDASAGCIEAVFGTHIVSWVAMLLARQDDLINDIANGTICRDLPLGDTERRYFESRLPPDRARAAALQAAFAAGEQGLLARLWPKLRVLSTAVSGGFAVSLPRLRLLAGDQVRICGTCYGATECMVGVNLWPSLHERYALSPGAAYFEFLPLDDAVSRPLKIADVHVGECYELVVTTFAGLYRYRLGDVVRICDRIGDTPVFEFDHRLGDVMDLVGEKTTQQHTQTVVALLAEQCFGSADAISNYTVAADLSVTPYRYRVYLELTDEALAERADCIRLAELFDAELQRVNLSYRTLARANQRLGLPEVRLVRRGTFAYLEEQSFRSKAGISRNQIKTPRAVKDPSQISLLDERTLATSGQPQNSPQKSPQALPEAAP